MNPSMNCFRAAPGGMSQIVLVAMATGADVAMISSYHIFRIFLYYLSLRH